MTSNHSVERHLDLEIVDYDREIRRLVPHYDEMIAEGIDVLRRLVAPAGRVLDLGSGTGRLAAAILSAMPEATVTLLDVDPSMLSEARRRLAGCDRVSFVEGSFLDPIPRCEAVVACLSLHHVCDATTKTNVYRAIFRALPPGAPFLNLDATVSDDPALSALTFTRWADAMGTHGIDEASARRHFAAWSREERYLPLAGELDALAQAGFAKPECFWRKGPVAVYGGRRPWQP